MAEEKKPLIGMFWSVVIFCIVSYFLLVKGIPALSRKLTGFTDIILPVPATLQMFWAILLTITIFMYVSFDEARIKSFMEPILKLLKGEYSKPVFWFVLIIIPLGAGNLAWSQFAPKMEAPIVMRIQHPSSNFPKKNEDLNNPFKEPSKAELEQFIKQVKADNVQFVPQTGHGPRGIDFLPFPEVQEFIKKVKSGGQPTEKEAEHALMKKRMYEGRTLYEFNCRPCHGDKADGNGPMADGFRLRPIDFSDNGTLETVVEGYIFWRVRNGGPGLPVEATPWNSAMPIWKKDLTDDQIWMIMMGELQLANKTARQPEAAE